MFTHFAHAVHTQFSNMSQHELYQTNIDPDALYAAYLQAFPEGTNPIFRTNTEHECSCCRNFIKNIGGLVAIIDGQVHTVWDGVAMTPTEGTVASELAAIPAHYRTVAARMASLVRRHPITTIYRTDQRSYGAETSKEFRDGSVHTWHHFHGKIAPKHFSASPQADIGAFNAAVQVFQRGLSELAPHALATIAELIADNQLYRGEQYASMVAAFRGMQTTYLGDPDNALGEAGQFVLQNATAFGAQFRNTLIGTLAIDLTEGMPLEKAVKAYESKAAPENYKRPKALITQRMIDEAVKTLEAEGLEPALHRRHARISDITMNNVLWADNSVKPLMKGGVADLLKPTAVEIIGSNATEIGFGDFLRDVVPTAQSIDAYLRNDQMGNFVSLTAPVADSVQRLFKWDNNFAWSYAAGTDSLKERVKAAGGKVEGDLLCRLAWDYTDDLDFHMIEPSGHRIYYGSIRCASPNGGMLDVDANGIDGQKADPVENIYYTSRSRMRDGLYHLEVNNFSRRSEGAGFIAQIEFEGQIHEFAYGPALRSRETVQVATIQLKDGKFSIVKSLPATASAAQPKEMWGVQTNTRIKVNTLLRSPNYWDENASGQHHAIFVLDGCLNPEPVRGFYNEFLRPELDKHRRVFETLAGKMLCPLVPGQLSGVGFSGGHTLQVSVSTGKTRRAYTIKF